jgi:hypothetical protein
MRRQEGSQTLKAGLPEERANASGRFERNEKKDGPSANAEGSKKLKRGALSRGSNSNRDAAKGGKLKGEDAQGGVEAHERHS